jgi:hypothetical protein
MAAILATVAVSCRDDGVSPETAAPGEAARVIVTSSASAGGRERRQETRIDSAAGRYTLLECSSAPVGVSCTALVVVREGSVAAPVLRDLFAASTRPEFRALRADYPGPAAVRPPDGGGARLEIVRGGTRRVITWAFDATLPRALVEYNCILLAARADPFLCD